MSARIRALSIQLAGEEPPTEFRLFKAGVNDTSKGPALFDEAAAEAVMAAFKAYGNDLIIDLEHLSLDDPTQTPRTDTTDARGHFQLEVRNGELWAVNVRWNPDGERRLKEKTQRYVSPAFYDDDEGRVLEVVNVALCSMPATHNAQALVAAARVRLHAPHAHATLNPAKSETGKLRQLSMDASQIQAALDALESGDLEACKQALKDMIAGAAGGSAADASGAEAASETADPPPATEEEKAALAALRRETGREVLGDAVKALATMRARVAEIDRQEKALEDGRRLSLIADLVKLGAETPATAWANAEKREPVERLANEPLADLDARVKALSAAKGGKSEPKPPVSRGARGASDEGASDAGGRDVETPHGKVTLSAREIANCKELKADVEQYAANKAIRAAAKRGGN